MKAMRRIREDRAQHGSDRGCPCFEPDGATFSRFADHPKQWSGSRRRNRDLTLQERRAATIEDWDDP
ncbi:MAG TPA: hypothetical protein VGN59_16700 [Acidimicrobiia bacterium]